MDIRKFKFKTPQKDLDDLKNRLALTRWPDPETPNDWSQGVPLDYMQSLCKYWQEEYNWNTCQERLNSFPQFVAEIDGLEIQFMHIKSKNENAVPLLMTHGWPGSILEFTKVIESLTNPNGNDGFDGIAFHLICPTLPGYGYSGKPASPGWSLSRIAEAWNSLMLALGYKKYFAQGGDWGAAVTLAIAVEQTTNCIGIHTNMPVLSVSEGGLRNLTDFEKECLAGHQYYWDKDSGYSKEQSTRPQTIGYGLVDSPVAQCAWIIEKFWSWMDCEGHPENILTRDELLDNVMMYWLPGTGASSARMYWENFHFLGEKQPIIEVPAAVSIFPNEIFRSSKRWCEERFKDLRHYNRLKRGGHFAAFEQPDLFTKELRESFTKML